jgi:hypothetical protein
MLRSFTTGLFVLFLCCSGVHATVIATMNDTAVSGKFTDSLNDISTWGDAEYSANEVSTPANSLVADFDCEDDVSSITATLTSEGEGNYSLVDVFSGNSNLGVPDMDAFASPSVSAGGESTSETDMFIEFAVPGSPGFVETQSAFYFNQAITPLNGSFALDSEPDGSFTATFDFQFTGAATSAVQSSFAEVALPEPASFFLLPAGFLLARHRRK